MGQWSEGSEIVFAEIVRPERSPDERTKQLEDPLLDDTTTGAKIHDNSGGFQDL
jgi:hypothetical protein